MKNQYIFSILLVLICSGSSLLQLQAQEYQEFAPIGAKWWYGVEDANMIDTTTVLLQTHTCIGDTTIENKDCRVVISEIYYEYDVGTETVISNESYVNDTIYYHQIGGLIYRYRQNAFWLYYNFEMEANDGEWITGVEENDTSYSFVMYTDNMTVNETVLRTYKPGNYTSVAIGAGELVIEKLGSLLNECGYLRCYEDSELGFYSTGIAEDCEMIFTNIETPLLQNGTDGENQQKMLSLHPNPNRGATLLQLTEGLIGEQIEVVIYDLQGKQWQIQRFEANQQSQWMATNDLPEGIYICVLKINGEQKEQVKMVVLK